MDLHSFKPGSELGLAKLASARSVEKPEGSLQALMVLLNLEPNELHQWLDLVEIISN